jgi:hypothetical protein
MVIPRKEIVLDLNQHSKYLLYSILILTPNLGMIREETMETKLS